MNETNTAASPQASPPYGHATPSPALYYRSPSYPFGDLVPKAIRAMRNISASSPSTAHITEGCEYDAWVDSDGNVFAMLPNGAKVGPLRAETEYKVIKWWKVDGKKSIEEGGSKFISGFPFMGWRPTPENINALPPPLRRHIHDLETNANPAGVIAECAMAKDQIVQLSSALQKEREAAKKFREDATDLMVRFAACKDELEECNLKLAEKKEELFKSYWQYNRVMSNYVTLLTKTAQVEEKLAGCEAKLAEKEKELSEEKSKPCWPYGIHVLDLPSSPPFQAMSEIYAKLLVQCRNLEGELATLKMKDIPSAPKIHDRPTLELLYTFPKNEEAYRKYREYKEYAAEYKRLKSQGLNPETVLSDPPFADLREVGRAKEMDTFSISMEFSGEVLSLKRLIALATRFWVLWRDRGKEG